MKNHKTKLVAGICISLLVAMMAVAGCSSGQEGSQEGETGSAVVTARYDKGDVHASVEVLDSEVDRQLDEERAKYSSDDDAAWEEYLVEEYGMSSGQYRNAKAKELADEKLLAKIAESLGVEAGDEAVDEAIGAIRNETGMELEEYLGEIGTDDEEGPIDVDEFKADLGRSLTKSKLAERYAEQNKDVLLADEQMLLKWINSSYPAFMGTALVSTIVLDKDSPDGSKALAAAQADFDSAKASYGNSTDYDGVIGLNAEEDSAIVEAASSTLPGQVCPSVVKGEEHDFVVKVISFLPPPENEYSSLAEVPAEYLELYRQDAAEHIDAFCDAEDCSARMLADAVYEYADPSPAPPAADDGAGEDA